MELKQPLSTVEDLLHKTAAACACVFALFALLMLSNSYIARSKQEVAVSEWCKKTIGCTIAPAGISTGIAVTQERFSEATQMVSSHSVKPVSRLFALEDIAVKIRPKGPGADLPNKSKRFAKGDKS